MIIRTTSHRARERMTRRLGRYPLALYSLELGSGYYEIEDGEFERLTMDGTPVGKRIPGITRARVKREQLSKCWV